jgi:hypothetical protein
VLGATDGAASPRLGILGGGVNNLDTTFRDAIAVENAIVRAEADPTIARRANSKRSRQTESDVPIPTKPPGYNGIMPPGIPE